MFKIYYSTYEQQIRLVFDIYDFDKDGYVTPEDVRIILSYIPMINLKNVKVGEKEGLLTQEGGGFEDFQDRLRTQGEIQKMVDMCFDGKTKVDLTEFSKISEEKASDMLLSILNLLKMKLPCSENFYHYQADFEKSMKQKEVEKSPTSGKTRKVASPMMRSLSPTAGHRKDSPGQSTASSGSMLKGNVEESKIQLDKFNSRKEERRRRAEAQAAVSAGEDPNSPGMQGPAVRLANIKGAGGSTFASPSHILNPDIARGQEEQKKEPIQHEGEMMRKAKENKLKKYHYCLLEKELYVYKHKDDENHKQMINLVGIFIKEEPEEALDKKNILYPFTLISANKERTFYLQDKGKREEWMTMIKKAIGYANLFDFYDVKEALGKGKFGTVKLGIHKKTGKKVAIKVMKKKAMTKQDVELQKREIEILKICQHPNICKLIDVFENQDYIYIVMEYLKGGDLFNYLESRDFTITQERARQLSHEIGTAIYYLHNFGIAHRDLKPENILMTTNDDEAHPKLVDFGLSKIIGPGETCNDPFGTLSYVAPEVLLQKPYDKMVDLWSLGVIVYLLLSGTLPFDDDDDREIAR